MTHIGQWRTRFAQLVLIPDLAGQDGRMLRNKVFEDGELTPGYMLMCGLSAGIAALGMLQSSVAVVIGAMLISPLMTPIVALGFGFASFDGKKIKDAARVVAVGAAIGIVTAILLTWISPIRNATPEIIARTQPTLLDLAVALFSGIAGGYSIVTQKGATAIGVAIATALMPPLAVVGYGIGVARFDFAGGAFLLFLTNLAAIAFAIALIARLSGAARPLRNVVFTWRYIVAGVGAFAVLATPLALTLIRVSQEASARAKTQNILKSVLHVKERNIAQLDLKWPLRGKPVINVVVIAANFESGAQTAVLKRLTKAFGTEPELTLQQVIAADITSQTRAMIDAAMERTVTGIASDVPPYVEIRASLGIPVDSVWTNRADRTVNIAPVAAPGWTLADYKAAEAIVAKSAGGWEVRLEPPVQERLLIRKDTAKEDIALAIWAIRRWGLTTVRINSFSRNSDDEDALKRLDDIGAAFLAAKINTTTKLETDRNERTEVEIFGLSPSQKLAAQAEQLSSTSTQ